MTLHLPLLERYRALLHLPDHAKIVSLLEGFTPLIPMPRLVAQLGGGFQLNVKFEGLNPTGSFKDRGMTAAVSEAFGRGAGALICASTGNTAGSAAAYAARAGLRCVVLIPAGKVAAGKLAGAVAYGAQVLQIEGSFDDALSLVVEISQRHPIALVNSLNPYRLEGQKTAAFEIIEELGRAPDWLCLPVGNAGNITAYWMGFKQYHQLHTAAGCLIYLACKLPVPRRWCLVIRSSNRKRLRQPFGSASRHAASKRLRPPTNQEGASLQQRMTKSFRCNAAWQPKACGSSRPLRRAWPG